jgi:uncharacterized protein (DUF1778 family)
MDEITQSLIDIGIRYTQLSQTAFIRSAVREKVERLAEENKMLTAFASTVLTEAESERFIRALERDFVPTQALLELNKRSRQDVVELV